MPVFLELVLAPSELETSVSRDAKYLNRILVSYAFLKISIEVGLEQGCV